MRESVLVELERAELAARERRLAASDEADRRLAAARAEAESIRASVGDAVRQALEARRREHAERATAEVAAIEAAARALGPDDDSPAAATPESDAEAAAAALVVAAVLGEGTG